LRPSENKMEYNPPFPFYPLPRPSETGRARFSDGLNRLTGRLKTAFKK